MSGENDIGWGHVLTLKVKITFERYWTKREDSMQVIELRMLANMHSFQVYGRVGLFYEKQACRPKEFSRKGNNHQL